jgi:CRP-like cAMP-binding protein
MVIGGTFYGFIIASMSAIVAAVDANTREFTQKMDLISSYMTHHNFPPELKIKMRTYFKKFFEFRSALDEQAILNDLDPQLQQEVGMFLLNDVVRSNRIFATLPKELLTKIVLILRPHVAQTGQVLMREGEIGTEMYMMISGELTLTRLDGTVQILRQGASAGELVGLGIDPTYESTIIAADQSELYLLSSADMSHTFEPMPDVLRRIRADAIDIMERRRDDWQTGMYASEVGSTRKLPGDVDDGDESSAEISAEAARAKKRSTLMGGGGSTLPPGFADTVLCLSHSYRWLASQNLMPHHLHARRFLIRWMTCSTSKRRRSKCSTENLTPWLIRCLWSCAQTRLSWKSWACRLRVNSPSESEREGILCA